MSSPLNLSVLMPEIILSFLALLVFLVGAWDKRGRSNIYVTIASFTGVLLIGFLLISCELFGGLHETFYGLIISDSFSKALGLFVIVAGLLVIMISDAYLSREGINKPEYYGLLMLSIVGSFFMLKASDLLTLFLGLEILSMPLYILCSFKRTNLKSSESGIKYFLLGAFTTSILLYGTSFIYGALSSVSLQSISRSFNVGEVNTQLFFIGLSLVIVSLAFKVALAPFHVWVPDVYEGAPTPITAFMAAVVKIAAFGALMRILYALPEEALEFSRDLGTIIAILTMFVGNLGALMQNNIKRLLAYSSIAHAGYMLVGLLSYNTMGVQGVLYYLLAYTFMNIGAFAVVVALGQKGEQNVNVEDYRGLGFKYPFLGVSMAIFMLSMVGIPPTAGFVGKYYLFASALMAGMPLLAILGVVNSVLSLGYYLRVLVIIFMVEQKRAVHIPKVTFGLSFAVLLCAFFVLKIGIFPAPYLTFMKQSVVNSHVLSGVPKIIVVSH